MKKMNVETKHLKIAGIAAMLVAVLATVAFAAGGAGHGNHWLEMDTWKTLNFGVLAVALFFLGKKPVVEFFSSRKKDIEDELKELETKKAQAEKTLAEYQAKFKNLDQESKQIVADYVKQGEEAKKRIIAEAKEQAEKLEDTAKRNIEQEFKAAKAMLQQEVVERAMAEAEAVIKESITPDDQDKLVDDYLKKVVA